MNGIAPFSKKLHDINDIWGKRMVMQFFQDRGIIDVEENTKIDKFDIDLVFKNKFGEIDYAEAEMKTYWIEGPITHKRNWFLDPVGFIERKFRYMDQRGNFLYVLCCMDGEHIIAKRANDIIKYNKKLYPNLRKGNETFNREFYDVPIANLPCYKLSKKIPKPILSGDETGSHALLSRG